ncbi:5-dehydro-4-deoxyglucarate dehydratase [Rhizomicrobium sp. SCGC AG-212-E05]|nr:5-dehydro-4-deoxyglucarate dehydratase [Rhizomicrobium sp. SCGC AG-212-E05]
MSKMSPAEMAQILAKGLLSFPVTHFDKNFQFQEGPYREHCAWLLGFKRLTGLFAAGGTGEFFSLSPAEVGTVVSAAVKETAGRTPVIAGCGYGTAIAIDLAKSAEAAGADGLLLLPPYLMTPNQEGLMAHVEAVCKATKIGVIVYNRDNAVLTADSLAKLCERNSNLVGFKDGVGDIELMMQVYAKMGDRLTYVGGLPTAETFALPYLEMGVTTYSSAIYNFMPEWALSFYDAVRAKDHGKVMKGLKEFVLPYIAIRNESRGYAVSIVKAGMTAIGRTAGPVRQPLTDLNADQFARLKNLIEATKPV